MSDAALNLNLIFNLRQASVLVVDDCPFSLDITAQVLMAFGVRPRFLCGSADEALEVASHEVLDLIIADCEMPGRDGYEMVAHLRRHGGEVNAYCPVIMLSSHTPRSKVLSARDCGANFIIAKPLSPRVLLQRILWVARDTRPFLEAPGYVGPDRRFTDQGPPATGERRAGAGEALKEAVGG